ncbi:MAG: hypothetical protein WCJ32_07365 [Actinomycetota bacterium]|jgi:hypothetical protein|nr:hypothetical protein [Actinomycetota bacterium]
MAQAQHRVTRDDLEAKFRAVQGDVQNKVEDRKQTLLAGVVAGGVILLVAFFLMGRRSGKSKNTFVEIRRV